jgi:hypothetical protein
VHQVQDQSHVQFLVDSNLERTLAVGQSQTGQRAQRVAAVHLFSHFLDDGVLALE